MSIICCSLFCVCVYLVEGFNFQIKTYKLKTKQFAGHWLFGGALTTNTHTNIDKEQSCRIHFERINLFFFSSFIRLFLFEKWSKSDFISLTKQKDVERKYNITKINRMVISTIESTSSIARAQHFRMIFRLLNRSAVSLTEVWQTASLKKNHNNKKKTPLPKRKTNRETILYLFFDPALAESSTIIQINIFSIRYLHSLSTNIIHSIFFLLFRSVFFSGKNMDKPNSFFCCLLLFVCDWLKGDGWMKWISNYDILTIKSTKTHTHTLNRMKSFKWIHNLNLIMWISI